MNYETEDTLNQIKAVQTKMDNLKIMTTEAIKPLLEKQQAIANTLFENDKGLQDSIKEISENPKDYDIGNFGNVFAWTRYSLEHDSTEMLDLLDTYLSETETFCSWNRENECLQYDVGCSFLIYQDGVYDQDSDGFIIDSKLYTEDGEINEAKRNKLIEEHMEKTGCFPGVYSCDQHNNVLPVDIIAKD